MRILANYGADPRFRVPARAVGARVGSREGGGAREREARERAPALGGLVGYDGSGEEDEEDEESGSDACGGRGRSCGGRWCGRGCREKSAVGQSADDPVKEARRARAREWAEKRRAMKADGAEALAEDV